MISLHRRSDGAFLTTLSATADRSWVMNDKGKCTLYLSTQDEKTIRAYMGERNLICITHEKLPMWAGVIETDQDWDDRGGVQFTAWSAASLWIGRCPTQGQVKAASPGALFEKLVAIGNEDEDLLIRVGEMYRGGGDAETILDGTNLLEVIKDLAARWDMEFEVAPKLSSRGALSFEANWHKRMGDVIDGFSFVEDLNMKKTSRPLRVTRQVVNRLIGFGEASTDGDRPKATKTDAGSVNLFGLMEGTEDFDGVTDQTTVEEQTAARLLVLRLPKKIVNVNVLDVENAFKATRLGNRVNLRATSFGFRSRSGVGLETVVRIMSMRYLERSNVVEIKNQTEDFEL